MSLDHLLASNQDKNKKKETPKKEVPTRGPSKAEPQHAFTLRHDLSTKVLMDKLQKLKELTDPAGGRISQGDIVREGLDLLAEKMELSKNEKKFPQFMKFIEEKNNA